MNIIFGKVSARNFMSFRRMDFDFNSFCGQNVLIYGMNEDIKGESVRSNGSGKSTIMNALLFALYGDILNTVKLGHLRNWNCPNKEEVSVTLDVETNGTGYRICRTLRGKKGEQELHVFRKDGEEWDDATLSTVAETQRMIEGDIVMCGKDGFLRCVLLTADQNYNFFKLGKAAKNQFFESLFELTKYSDMYARLHRMTLDVTASLTASSRTIDSLNENIVKLKDKRKQESLNMAVQKDAEKAVADARAALEDFEAKNDVDAEVARLDCDVERRRQLWKEAFETKVSAYDSGHGICSVDGDGRIVFDDSEVDEAVRSALSRFDSENSIKVDSSGNIDFGEGSEYDDIVSRGKGIKDRIEKGEEISGKLEKEISDGDAEIMGLRSDAIQLEGRIRDMRLTLSAHSRITDILCEDCLPKYRRSVEIEGIDERIEDFERKVSERNGEIAEIEKTLEGKRSTLKRYVGAIAELNSSLLEMRRRAAEILAGRKSIQKEREMCRKASENEVLMAHREKQASRDAFVAKEKANAEKNFRYFSEVQGLRKKALLEERDRLRKALSDAEYRLKVLKETSERNFDAPIAALNDSLESAKSEFYELSSRLSHYRALEEILKPDNIRKSVVGDMLKELNFRICGYLSKMGSNYTCRFDEDFEATFVSSAGLETEYNNFSSGEKMRLGIACCLAFRDFMQVRLDLHPNILAIDEYIDSNLDPMAVNGIMEMIRYMVGTEGIAAFVISHRSEVMQGMFDSEVMVRKRGNESSLFVNWTPGEV